MSDQDDQEADPLLFEVTDGVALLTLNRPHEGNAMAPNMLVALEAAWRRVNDDLDIRVVIMTGAGARHFCTGASVAQLEVGRGSLNNLSHQRANLFTPQQMHVTKPVICVVNGLCNGGGLHFVAEADIVIAHEQVQFMDTHVAVGQVSALESLGIARRAGPGAALLMGLAGRGYRMPATRAYQLGMVDLLEPTGEAALARGWELARAMAQNSPQAMALTKRAIWAVAKMHDPAALEFGWELLKSHWRHPDFEEGPRAFVERRAANWNPDPNARR
ncbi:enoyl-CoA hydratase/isomerase family protein [Sphingomonas bacterium]|uniref:enoyl-CoA hydratase/isomerase family protein n=1 Tax=Sphingomonas bacterium TaxID=1895847 RepID=UPI001575B789|nr:enoyl-CoA hydratase/isomerase family protein [Sphingomonas bacterium]